MSYTLTGADRTTLRELARKVAQAAADPIQALKADLWRRHNDLERGRPMVLIFPEGAWREMLPDTELVCSTPFGRGYERDLKVRLYYAEHMPDDNVIEPVVYSPILIGNTGWGIETQVTRPDQATGAYQIDPVIESEADLDRMRTPEIVVDWADTERRHEQVQSLFGDILTVERHGRMNYGLAPVDFYAQLRGIDQMFMDLVDNPRLVHRAIGQIVEGHIAMVRSLEKQELFSLGNLHNHYVGSGGVAYTRQLPQKDFDGRHVRPMDLWGSATAQIFSEVSPAMHEEFALQHEKRVLELFGLNCYGCCEPLHNKLDLIFKHIPRLRRVSISPWADVEKSAAQIGRRCVFSWKPNPAIMAGERWNPAAVRKSIRAFCEKTRGCVVEIIMKDTHTCRNQPQRMWDWVKVAREVAAEF